MPDLLDELRRYADAVEAHIPSRDLPEPRRRLARRRTLALVAAGVAAALLVATLVLSNQSQPTEIDTVEVPDTSEPQPTPVEEAARSWRFDTVGTTQPAIFRESLVWFGDSWWRAGGDGGRLLRSADVLTWRPSSQVLDGSRLQLVADDEHLVVVGVDDAGTIVTAATDDTTSWRTATVGPSSRHTESANFAVAAVETGFAIAVMEPSAELELYYEASAEVSRLVREQAAQDATFEFDDNGIVTITAREGGTIFEGNLGDFGISAEGVAALLRGQTDPDFFGSAELAVYTSTDGLSWQRTAVPASADGPAGFVRSHGQMLMTTSAHGTAIAATTDGHTWLAPNWSSELEVTATTDGVWRFGRPWMNPAVVERAPALGDPFTPVIDLPAVAVATSIETTAVLVDRTPPDWSEQDDLDARFGWAVAEFLWTDGSYEYAGSYISGGTLTELDTGRTWTITYDDFVGLGDTIERDGNAIVFVDPATTDVLVRVENGFRDTIVEQYPQYADVIDGTDWLDPTPEPDLRLEVVVLGDEAQFFPLPPLPPESIARLVPGPDGSFLILAFTDVERLGDGGRRLTEQTVFRIVPE